MTDDITKEEGFMPARKSPLGFKQKHYDAEQVSSLLNVSLSKAYEIIYQCRVYGEVIKAGGSLRVSESALNQWYETHTVTGDPEADALKLPMLAKEREKRRPGRPRKGGVLCVD